MRGMAGVRKARMWMPRLRPTPFVWDLLGTSVTSVVTIICLAVTTRLLVEGLGAEQFGAYSLARRLVSTIEPLSTLAMGIAIARYLAISRDEDERASYVIAGTFLVAVPALALMFVGLIFSVPLAHALFLDGVKYHTLSVATVLLTVAYSFYILLYAYYRGIGRMPRANLWQVSMIALGPLAIAWTFARSCSVGLIVSLMTALFLCSTVPLAKHLVDACRRWRGRTVVILRIRELARYGLPRVAGGFAFGGLLAVGPMLAPCFGSLKDAGYLVVGQMILRMVEGGTEAFGRVALPRIAQVFAESGKEVLRDRIEDLISLILHVGVYASVHLLIWSRLLIVVWLGPGYADAILPVRITLVGLVPYLAFVTLRAVVDAIEVRAVNATALYISLIVTATTSVALAWSGFGLDGLALATAVGLVVLGGLVGTYVWRAFAIDWHALHLGACASTNLVFALAALIAKFWLQDVFSRSSVVWGGLIVEGALFLTYLFWLRNLGARWIQQLEHRLIVNRE